jgi:ABC-type Fe3+ transport system substrate-binding protein
MQTPGLGYWAALTREKKLCHGRPGVTTAERGMAAIRKAAWMLSARLPLALAAVLLAVPLALAQTNEVAKIATYQGADREQRLIEGAKKERELTLYSAIPPEDIAAVTAAFDKKYGIKVKVWRADSESILKRVLDEARGRRYEVDLMVASSSAIEPLARESLLQVVNSPYLADLRPEAIAPHRQWAAVYLSAFVQAYNTNLVRKEMLPDSFRGFTAPEWKGRLGVEAEDYDWFAQVVMELGEAAGLRLFREIVARNGISVRKGHTLLSNLVVSGEVPLALTAYSFSAEQSKRKGAPIDWFVLPPAIARLAAQGLARNAPHPNAAVLFYDFLISDAQPILADRYFVPASRKIETPLNLGPFKIIDTARILDHARKWQELFQKIILNPSR